MVNQRYLSGSLENMNCAFFFFVNTNTKQVSGTTLIIQADWKVSKHQLSLKKKNQQLNKNPTHFDKSQLGMRFFFPL